MTPTLLKLDTYTMDQAKDPLFRGEFEVVKELLAKLKNGAAAKNVCDKVLSGSLLDNHSIIPDFKCLFI